MSVTNSHGKIKRRNVFVIMAFPGCSPSQIRAEKSLEYLHAMPSDDFSRIVKDREWIPTPSFLSFKKILDTYEIVDLFIPSMAESCSQSHTSLKLTCC